MVIGLKPSPELERAERVRSVCSPCAELLRDALDCQLLRRGGQWFLKVFEAKRCRPREFIEGFLRRRLAGKFGREHSEHVKDIASEVVLDLTQRPPRTFPSPDLIGLRRVLAGRAHQVQVDYWRKIEGRVRCGNCAHHRAIPDHGRECAHPDPRHPWTGRTVQASLDPRTFEPPCDRYSSRRERVQDQLDGQDLLSHIPDPKADVQATLVGKQRGAILVDCLAAVQRTAPRVSFVLMMSFLRHKTNEEIATALKTTVRTVTRYKERGLQLLHQELETRGVSALQDLV